MEKLGVLFVRLKNFPVEIIANVNDLGEAGYLLDKPRGVNAIPIEGEKDRARIQFMPVLNPFAKKGHDEIRIAREEVLFLTPPSGEMVGNYQNVTSSIIAPSLNLKPVQ